MQTRQLGNTDMHITPVGFGAWAIGGGWEFGWGPQDDQDSIEAIHRALDLGMNWIDTAAVYGLGRSEKVVARALKGVAKRPYVFTKCSLVWDDKGAVFNNLDPQSIRREVEDSLRRLEVDVIDLYQIHWPNPEPDIEQGWQTLADLKAEGKLRWIGVSNFDVTQMRRILPIAPISSLQPPYSLLDRRVEKEILPFCEQNNIGVIAYSPMASGLLTGAMTRERVAQFPADDHRSKARLFQEPHLTHGLELAEKLREIGKRHGRTVGEVAIAWTLRLPAVTGAIVGARNGKQVDGVIGAMDFRLSDAELAEIEAFEKQQA
ncbi:MAG: aldo/keto reductase [Anaerolineae bacterium]|nr:aldo/keto reductase [Anaerolineae bacterium]